MATGAILGALGGGISYNMSQGLLGGGLGALLRGIYGLGNQYDVGYGSDIIGQLFPGVGWRGNATIPMGPSVPAGGTPTSMPILSEVYNRPASAQETEAPQTPYRHIDPARYPQTIPNITLNPVETRNSTELTEGIPFQVLPPYFLQNGAVNMSLDLGGLLSQAIGAVTQYQLAGLQGPQQQTTTQVGQYPLIPDSLENLFGLSETVTTGAPAVANNVGMVFDPKANCGAGAWVKKCRKKRRRRLATPSDIKDLAALRAVTSPAEMKTWIATHPS